MLEIHGNKIIKTEFKGFNLFCDILVYMKGKSFKYTEIPHNTSNTHICLKKEVFERPWTKKGDLPGPERPACASFVPRTE